MRYLKAPGVTRAFLTFLLITCFVNVKSQKLPNVQPGSLRAPAEIKIDGKLTEWDNKFQAYNNATDIFYTISNDADNLYLVVQAADPSIIKKILKRGITFSIDLSNKRQEAGPQITYPFLAPSDITIDFKNTPQIIPGSPFSVKEVADFMERNNKILTEKSKYLLTKGFKGMDTLTSISNENGLKAAVQFDNKMIYTSELAISLIKLGINQDYAKEFAYHIKLNGVNPDDLSYTRAEPDNTQNNGAPLRLGGTAGTQNPNTNNETRRTLQLLTATTDFWGEYTLAKK